MNGDTDSEITFQVNSREADECFSVTAEPEQFLGLCFEFSQRFLFVLNHGLATCKSTFLLQLPFQEKSSNATLMHVHTRSYADERHSLFVATFV